MNTTRETWLRERFPEIVGMMLFGGFALTLAELLLMRHTEKTQMVGVVMTGVGMLMLGLGLVLGPRLRKVMAAALMLVAASGLFGTYEHLEEAQEHREKAERKRQESALVIQKADFDASSARISEAGEGDSEEGDPKKEEKHGPPPLAPLSLSGLALMGGLAIVARRPR